MRSIISTYAGEEKRIKRSLLKQKELVICTVFILGLIFYSNGSVIAAFSSEFGDTCAGLSTGEYHTCVLKSDGNVDCYGYNYYGDNYSGQANDYLESLTANPSVLWPPNHKMVPVTVSVSASDNCDAVPICKITSVSSNEPENGLGDGDTAPDWEITGYLTVNLRAERSGKGSGRIYTITVTCTYTCTDTAKNTLTGTTSVTVPHDQGKKKK